MMMTSNDAGKQAAEKKSRLGFSRVVTIDTTNKDPRPKDPRKGTGKGGKAIGSSGDVSISLTPLTRVLAP